MAYLSIADATFIGARQPALISRYYTRAVKGYSIAFVFSPPEQASRVRATPVGQGVPQMSHERQGFEKKSRLMFVPAL
jgi:hypothetical protein